MAGLLAALAAPLIGKLFGGGEDGIQKVPKTALYALHKGEMVIKKKDAKKVPKALKAKQSKAPKPTKLTSGMMKKSVMAKKK